MRRIRKLRAQRDQVQRLADGRDVAPRGAGRRPRRHHRHPGRALQLGEGIPARAREDDQAWIHYSRIRIWAKFHQIRMVFV